MLTSPHQAPAILSPTTLGQLDLRVDFIAQPYLHYHQFRTQATSLARTVGHKLNPLLGLNEFFIVMSDAEYLQQHNDAIALTTTTAANPVDVATPARTRTRTTVLRAPLEGVLEPFDSTSRPRPPDPGRANETMDTAIKQLIHKEAREDFQAYVEASIILKYALIRWIGPAHLDQLTSTAPRVTVDDLLPHNIINFIEARYGRPDLNTFDTLNSQLTVPCSGHSSVLAHLAHLMKISDSLTSYGVPIADLMLLSTMYKTTEHLPAMRTITTLYNQQHPHLSTRSAVSFQEFVTIQLPNFHLTLVPTTVPTYVAATQSVATPRDSNSIKSEIASLNRQLRALNGSSSTSLPVNVQPKTLYCFLHNWNSSHWTETCKTLQSKSPDLFNLCKSTRAPCKIGNNVGAGFIAA